MEAWGLGAGLGAIAFWGFIAVCVWAGIWDGIRKRETKHETLRRLIESGQPVDESMLNKLFGGDQRLDRQLKAYGLVVVFLAPGLAVLGWLLSYLADWALFPLLGAAIVLACLGVGLLVASKAIERSHREDDASAARQTKGAGFAPKA